jgi:DNA topoisomerase-1
VSKQGKALVPSFTAFAVTRLLREHFADYVDVGFTAEMEEMLDAISNGQKDWLDFIRAFYRGDGKHTGLETIVQGKDKSIDYPMMDLGADPENGKRVRVRIGRYGPFLQLGDGGDDSPRASIPEEVSPAELTLEEALKLLRAKAEGPKSLGADPKSGLPVYVMHGRFGPYVQLGENPEKGSKAKPKRASLDRGMSEDGVSLDEALRLLSLPRELGAAEDGQMILANRGRFGPYVQKDADFRSLEATDDVYTITLERAKELLAKPKGQRRQRAAATELRAMGPHPKGGAAVRILDGRYGPRDRRRDQRVAAEGHGAQAVTMEQAVELLNARAGTPAKRRGASRGRGAASQRRRSARKGVSRALSRLYLVKIAWRASAANRAAARS